MNRAGRAYMFAMKPKQSDTFRDNAQNCALLAERAKDDAAFQRFKRMEAAWLALAEEQDWLDGEKCPLSPLLRRCPSIRLRSVSLFRISARHSSAKAQSRSSVSLSSEPSANRSARAAWPCRYSILFMVASFAETI
jgi:hypothetical protein